MLLLARFSENYWYPLGMGKTAGQLLGRIRAALVQRPSYLARTIVAVIAVVAALVYERGSRS